MAAFYRVSVDVVEAKKSFDWRFLIAADKPYYNDMHMCLAACVTAPCECSMGKRNFECVPVK